MPLGTWKAVEDYVSCLAVEEVSTLQTVGAKSSDGFPLALVTA
ncbi:hypothetical protein ACFCVY_18420 [Streptomyces sp. NPDC056411]